MYLLVIILVFIYLHKKSKTSKTATEDKFHIPAYLSQENNDEMFAKQYLSSLPGEYVIFNDVLLKSSEKSSQIDNIIVSRYGIFVIETKKIKAFIGGKRYQKDWIAHYGPFRYSFPNPLWQNYGHIKTLQKMFPNLQDWHFVSVVSFTDPNGLYVDYQPQPRQHVIRSRDISKTIRQYNTAIFSPSEFEFICETIEANNAQSPENMKEHIEYVEHVKSRYATT